MPWNLIAEAEVLSGQRYVHSGWMPAPYLLAVTNTARSQGDVGYWGVMGFSSGAEPEAAFSALETKLCYSQCEVLRHFPLEWTRAKPWFYLPANYSQPSAIVKLYFWDIPFY